MLRVQRDAWYSGRLGMIPGGLINSYWKVERAKKHLAELHEALGAYLNHDTRPYAATLDQDPHTGAYRLTVEVEEPHAWIFMVAGDVFNCLRSALDHALWRIASLQAGTPKTKLQFPIIEKDDDRGRRTFESQTDGLPATVIPVIEKLQPYNRRIGTPLAGHPLWCLGMMTNIDKHRYIAVHPTVAITEWGVPPTSEIECADRRIFVFRWPSSEQPPGLPDILVEVEFGSEADGISLPLQDVHEIVKCVNNVLLMLAPFDR